MKTYKNPIKKQEDLADPFVLRYNGKYYLYSTNPGVSCWSSKDLVNWELEGDAISKDEFLGLVPFAPEVVYWNGTFYMYTSPHGFGHYVLASSSPTGPFRKITDNVGHNIDISIFIDDDGTWYAYWADERGIVGCKMKSPTEFGDAVLVGAYLHGWTEGPFVVKKDGKYHLTYTGNHYLSKGYRIHAAISDTPLGPYRDNAYNPVVVCTEGDVVGLGHSCTVLAPDLHTYYVIYHNLNPDKTRDLNIDPVVFRQEGAYVLGPTTTDMQAPGKPDYQDDFTGDAGDEWRISSGKWAVAEGFRVSEEGICAVNMMSLPVSGAAEFHIAALEGTEHYGLLFPGSNELRLEINSITNRISLYDAFGIQAEASLPYPYLHEALHVIRLEYGRSLTVYVDNLKRLTADFTPGGHRFGYYADGRLRMGSTSFQDLEKVVLIYPTPCIAPCDSEIMFETKQQGWNQIAAIGCKNTTGQIEVDQRRVSAENEEKGNNVLYFLCQLKPGIHRLNIGNLMADHIAISAYYGSETEEIHVSNLGPYDKYCGKKKQTDGIVTAHFKVSDCLPGWQAGVLFRAGNLSDGGEGDDKKLGTNFFIGYRVSMSEQGIRLWKHRYDERLLAEAYGGYGDEIHLQIEMKDNRIVVGVGGTTLIQYQDSEPIMSGYHGFHVRNCRIKDGSINFCTVV